MQKSHGFTLIELMAVVLILGILASVAMTRYSTYTTRAAYSEVVLAAGIYKTGVEVCAVSHPMTDCDAGSNGVPSSKSSQAVQSVTVVDGLITVTPTTYMGLTAVNVYTLQPTGGGDGIQVPGWTDNCNANDFC